MKKLLQLTSAIAFLATANNANGQAAFIMNTQLDVNNITAGAQVHGDLWWDPLSTAPRCEFPKNSGKNIMAASSIWMAGYDNNNILHQSAQTYRQTGNDYWPGPLDNNGTLSYSTSTDWARIWKVYKTDVDGFKATTTHTLQNTPLAILEWPAKNNPYARGANNAPLTITNDMAPFIDVNTDGNYNPLDGDYPEMKGDQMLWWVFSDNGATHNNALTPSIPLKVEVHACAYGYKRNTLIDDVLYYEFKIANKSTNNYNKFRFGIWSDADLGYYLDDYIGFDSTRRMGIVYNGTSTDGFGALDHYGAQIPVAGITLLKMPGDNAPAYQPAGSFMYYNNDNSVMGNPEVDSSYDNYLRATWRNGAHLKNTFMGPGIVSTGYGSGQNTNYVFPGDPADKSKWSECVSGNYPGDRRFIITTNDYVFNAGSSTTVAFALVATQPGNNGCPNVNFNDIKIVADTAWKVFGNTPPTPQFIGDEESEVSPAVYPNPAHDKLYINAKNARVTIYNALGIRMTVTPVSGNGKTEINIATLPAGIYHVIYQTGDGTFNQTFVKE
jgi:hypothetical protein